MMRPSLTLEPNATPPRLTGWEEFVVWSTMNDPRFNQLAGIAARLGFNETQRLRMMLAAYCHALDEAQEQIRKLQAVRPLVAETKLTPAEWGEINATLRLENKPAPPEGKQL